MAIARGAVRLGRGIAPAALTAIGALAAVVTAQTPAATGDRAPGGAPAGTRPVGRRQNRCTR